MADGPISVVEVCGLPEALASKQDTLVIDSSPVHGSTNVATSGGVYDFVVESMQQLSSSVDNSLCETTSSVACQLSGKADAVHRHNIVDVDGLQDELTCVTVRINAVAEKADTSATSDDLVILRNSLLTPVKGTTGQDIYEGGRVLRGWYGALYSLGVRSSCVDLRTITLSKGCGSSCNEPSDAYAMVSTYVDGKLTLLYRSTVPVAWASTHGGCNVTFHLEPSTSMRLSSQDNIYIAITDCGCGDVFAVSGSFTLANSSSNPGASVNSWTVSDGYGSPCVTCDYAPYVWTTYSDVSYSGSLEGRMEHNISVLRSELQSVIVDTSSIVSSLCDTITSKQNALKAGNNIVISSDTISIATPDTTPIDGSTRLVTSGGVKKYVDCITGGILTALDEL